MGYTIISNHTFMQKQKGENIMSVIQITKSNFDEEVLKSDRPVLLDFWASWCTPCSMLSPVVDEVANETPSIKVGKINIDEEEDLASRFNVMSIPTLVYIKDGNVINTIVGVVPKTSILQMVQE